MLRSFYFFFFLIVASYCFGQTNWRNVDSLYQPLPKSVRVFFTDQPIDTSPFKAFYLIADLKDKGLDFTTDTTFRRRFTPNQFYQKNNQSLVVVNGTFFSFETNGNLNVVIRQGKLTSFNSKTARHPTDTTKKVSLYSSALGISKKRNPDIAWIKTDSSKSYAKAVQFPYTHEGSFVGRNRNRNEVQDVNYDPFKKWKMETAIGGGPVLIQEGHIKISNEEEQMFAGKAINDKHPRTAMGYTADNKLIILVVEGRNPNAVGATLRQEAQILKELGCVEALNLDGGGSSCLLINGKETINPSDKNGQRPVPAVFLIQNKK